MAVRALHLEPGRRLRLAHAVEGTRSSGIPSDPRRSLRAVDESIGRRSVAEFIGAFTLVFIGGGAGVVAGNDLVAVALANGLAIGLMVSNFGHISGGHFNPAITLGFVATRRITWPLAAAYWVSQLAGAAVAAGILRWLFHRGVMLGVVPHLNHINAGRGLVVEIILTFFLVIAVFANAVDPGGAFKAIAGLGIGLTITIGVLMGGPLTGAAMNPSRAFGPQLVFNHWNDAWIYWVGPAIGAVVAAVGYDYLYLRPRRPSVVGTPESGVAEPRPGDSALS